MKARINRDKKKSNSSDIFFKIQPDPIFKENKNIYKDTRQKLKNNNTPRQKNRPFRRSQ